jgi:very-short-patch-repair endonuclease
MYICKYCGREFDSKHKLAGHSRWCKMNPNFSEEILHTALQKARNAKTKKKYIRTQDKTLYHCKYCNRVCLGKNSLVQHEIRCKNNPDKINIVSNFIKYNKDIRDGKIDRIYKNQYDKANKLGLDKPEISEEFREKISKIHKGKKLSEDTKRRISETQKKNYKGRSKWYTQTQHRLSYAEQYFYEIFKCSEKHYHVDRYFLDVAYPEYKIYIEIDGEQHKTDPKVVQHDIIRTKTLSECGWTLVERIYWPDFIKLDFEDRKIYVDNIIKRLTTIGVSNI